MSIRLGVENESRYTELMGETAVNTLEKIEGRKTAQKTTISTQLIVKDSSL
jgi:hypothetical protein